MALKSYSVSLDLGWPERTEFRFTGLEEEVRFVEQSTGLSIHYVASDAPEFHFKPGEFEFVELEKDVEPDPTGILETAIESAILCAIEDAGHNPYKWVINPQFIPMLKAGKDPEELLSFYRACICWALVDIKKWSNACKPFWSDLRTHYPLQFAQLKLMYKRELLCKPNNTHGDITTITP